MKTQLLSILTAIILTGCATGEGTRTSLVEHSKTDPKSVQILLEKPEKPYEVIGFVSAKGGAFMSQSDIFEKMREEAAELGANAVYIRSDVREEVNYMDGDAYMTKKGNALAIRWK
jgi:hypothetical protein